MKRCRFKVSTKGGSASGGKSVKCKLYLTCFLMLFFALNLAFTPLDTKRLYGASTLHDVYSEETLTLEKCLELALVNNQTIKIAQQKLDNAYWKKEEAFAGYLPQLSASGTYLRKKKPDIPVQFLESAGRYYSLFFAEEIYTGHLSLEQPVFTWGRIYQANKQARLVYEIAKEEYRKIKNELIAQVKESFYHLLSVQQMVFISEEAVGVTAEHLKVTEAFYQEGKVPKYDVSRAKVQLANAKTNLIKAKNGLKLVKEGLFYLLNTKIAEDIEIQGELKYLPREIDLDTALKEALNNRPEIKEMELQEKIGKSLVKLSKAGNKPTLILTGNYDWQNDQLSTKDWYGTWQGLLILNVPLFDGFSTRAKVKQSETNLEQIKLSKELTIESIKLEVKQAVLNLQQAKESIEAQKENVDTAKDNLRIAQERYKLGLMSSIEVRDAELTLTQAETNYYQALAEYLIALVKLDKTMGR